MPPRKIPFSPYTFKKKNRVGPSPEPAPVPVPSPAHPTPNRNSNVPLPSPSPPTPGVGGWMSTPNNPPAALGEVVPVDLQVYFGIKSPNPDIQWPKFIQSLRGTHRKNSWAKNATKEDVLSEFNQRAGKTAYDYKLLSSQVQPVVLFPGGGSP